MVRMQALVPEPIGGMIYDKEQLKNAASETEWIS